eukprot:5403914-Pleurochrysis_carterae.AAC.1
MGEKLVCCLDDKLGSHWQFQPIPPGGGESKKTAEPWKYRQCLQSNIVLTSNFFTRRMSCDSQLQSDCTSKKAPPAFVSPEGSFRLREHHPGALTPVYQYTVRDSIQCSFLLPYLVGMRVVNVMKRSHLTMC